MRPITPCLWFDDQAEAAAQFYTSIFKNSKIKHIARYPKSVAAATGRPEGSVLTVLFELQGQEFLALNGGPQFKFTEAVSFVVKCKTQEEVDYYWDKLLAGGGQVSMCGWLKDRFGLSWQIVPTALPELLSDPDPAISQSVMKAMMQMKKLDIQALKEAARG
jgi:predicted 3-demethylubiquinone-9 3-methyltransferase (glyoxalase superfamily)